VYFGTLTGGRHQEEALERQVYFIIRCQRTE
jgi:hypothetical protein